MSKKINVLILCGGMSNERDISLKTGAQIAKAIPRNKYLATVAEITQEGKWLIKETAKKQLGDGMKSRALIPSKNDHKWTSFDVVFIGMHGKFGEDGKLQSLLEMVGIPYTGSGVLASALGMNKIKTLEIVNKHRIKTPKFITLRKIPNKKGIITLAGKIKETVGFPCVVKPNESGSSIGISIVHKKEELPGAIQKAFEEDNVVLVEEYIKGLELACAVMGNTSQTELIALPPVEIVPSGEFFDYDAKYSSELTKEICPARIGVAATKQIQICAKKIHEILGCDGFTRSDFILDKKKCLYFLEINTIPGLTENSLLPKEALAFGINFSQFLDKQVQLALLKHKK